MALTQVSDVVVPEIFSGYTQQLTEEKSRLVQSGALVRSGDLDSKLAGGGLTFNAPSFKDLSNDEENVSTDEAIGVNDSVPVKTGTATEIAVRLNRNQSWSSADLAGTLAGADPMNSIAQRVSDYWVRRQQAAFVATVGGVFADNDLAPGGGDQHTQFDMTNDISGASYIAGTTDFSAEAFIDAAVTMGDSMGDLSMIMVHSIVYSRMQKNNLIDFIPDARGEVQIPTFLGRMVIVDDSMPSPASGVYHSWIFGANALQLGVGTPKFPVEVEREAKAGKGGGQEILYNRVEWCLHPVGHAFVGTPADGGPDNTALIGAANWSRVYSERKQIKIARLVTREF